MLLGCIIYNLLISKGWGILTCKAICATGKGWLRLFKAAGQSHVLVLKVMVNLPGTCALHEILGKFNYYLTLDTYLENVSQFGL